VSGAADDRVMPKAERTAEVEALIREIQRYLSYLDAIRAGKPHQPPAQQPPST
jgi:hypothetical protein